MTNLQTAGLMADDGKPVVVQHFIEKDEPPTGSGRILSCGLNACLLQVFVSLFAGDMDNAFSSRGTY
jgi:hypothetical protein